MEQTPLQSTQPPATPPKNWLVESILVTLFCCFLPGIPAIIFAAQVNSKWANGDFEGARKASRDAALWTKIAFFIGIGLFIIYIILAVLGMGFSGFWMNRNNNY